MAFDEARVREWANAAGIEAAESLRAADLQTIRVAGIAMLASSDPPEVRINWEAVMSDGSVRPGDFDFDIELEDLKNPDDRDSFISIASSALFGHLAYSVVEPGTAA